MKLMKRNEKQCTGTVPTEEEVRAYFYEHTEDQGFALPKQRDWVEELEDD